ncbi:Proteophosphoglycan ppg4 [Rhodotorula diobovata]|uniref:Proteophosphoglycan ppg4 n=1 Tax=Rhodotorula diobovata TaxID=5288 RepID=A0A5C5G429_9BASI|nr:Proteophosphoglycan ppg4 [Rhodotorula diobovata]
MGAPQPVMSGPLSPAPPSGASESSSPPTSAGWTDSLALEYLEDEERFIIAFDVGNTGTSVTVAHLTWGSQPLSPSSSTLRTVLTYPFSSPSLTPNPSRTPSLVAYDRHDRARAFGAECLTPGARALALEEGWLFAKGWKEQVKPRGAAVPPTSGAAQLAQPAEGGNKLLKKLRAPLSSPRQWSTTPPTAAPLGGPPSASGDSCRPLSSARDSLRSLSSEGLLDAAGSQAEPTGTPTSASRAPDRGIDGGTGALADLGRGTTARLTKSKPTDKPSSLSSSPDPHQLYHGPRLRTIYADFLKWAVASARAWYAESTERGDETFVRCWDRARFVFAIPADWTGAEMESVRAAMEEARLLPAEYERGRLTFVKEPVAITFFAARHTKDSATWLEEGSSFAVLDAAEEGVSIIGYTVSSAAPRVKLRAYEAVTRVGAVLSAVSDLLAFRLTGTKFKVPLLLSHLLDEFRTKVLKRFAGAAQGPAEYRLRICPAGQGEKLEKAVDSGARIREGSLTLSSEDVESCFRPAVDAIVVRLSSILPRGNAKHVVLSGGFSESPYLVSRLRDAFSPSGVSLVIPDIPTHAAVSEGALAFFLSETLAPRQARHALGVQVAVDWATQWERGMHKREVFQGSGGRRLVQGKFGEIVACGTPLSRATTWRRTFNFRYRLAAQDPTFKATLWSYDPSIDDARDRWMVDVDGKPLAAYREVCEVRADLASLIGASEVHDAEGKAWVQLQVDLVVFVGEDSVEVAVEWEEKGKTVRGPASRLPQSAF